LPDTDLSNPDFSLWEQERLTIYDWRLFAEAAEAARKVNIVPLEEVIPDRGSIQDMAGTADVLERIQPVLAEAGLQEGFNLVYAAVSRRCHDVLAQNEVGKRYGPFRCPEVLNRTGPIFAEYALDAYRGYIWAVKMIQSGQAGPEAFQAVPPHWRSVILDQRLKESSKVEQFHPGMVAHIGGDLGPALYESDPPREYRADFIDKVSQILHDVADELTPELVDGNPEMFRALQPLVMGYILGMRVEAWRDFRDMQHMSETKRRVFIREKFAKVAVKNRITKAVGRVGVGAFRQTRYVPERAVKVLQPALNLFQGGVNRLLQKSIAFQLQK
jgi:hypothetical protein